MFKLIILFLSFLEFKNIIIKMYILIDKKLLSLINFNK